MAESGLNLEMSIFAHVGKNVGNPSDRLLGALPNLDGFKIACLDKGANVALLHNHISSAMGGVTGGFGNPNGIAAKLGKMLMEGGLKGPPQIASREQHEYDNMQFQSADISAGDFFRAPPVPDMRSGGGLEVA